jgi:hypothetical protein
MQVGSAIALLRFGAVAGVELLLTGLGCADTTGNFWVTPQRMAMGASFVLPFGSDDFYLIASNKIKAPTARDIMAKVMSP